MITYANPNMDPPFPNFRHKTLLIESQVTHHRKQAQEEEDQELDDPV